MDTEIMRLLKYLRISQYVASNTDKEIEDILKQKRYFVILMI